MRILSTLLLLTLVTAMGCGGYAPSPLPPVTPPPRQPAPASAAVPPPVAVPALAAAPVQPPQTGLEKADVGVGAKGNDYGSGMIATPIAAYFRSREAIAYRIQIPEALKLYKATTGHAPKTLEEFMQVMAQNQIKLPDLREGDTYVYDPEKEELMVSHPRR